MSQKKFDVKRQTKRWRPLDRCSQCERLTWRRHGNSFGWGREFLCSLCLADLLLDTEVIKTC